MVEQRFCLALELRNNALGQNIAKLNAPLVKRTDVPDDALSEDRVLIKGNLPFIFQVPSLCEKCLLEG
jgi:hypothetical protein